VVDVLAELARIGYADADEQLQRSVNGGESADIVEFTIMCVRFSYLKALTAIDPDHAAPFLTQGLLDGEGRVRLFAVRHVPLGSRDRAQAPLPLRRPPGIGRTTHRGGGPPGVLTPAPRPVRPHPPSEIALHRPWINLRTVLDQSSAGPRPRSARLVMLRMSHFVPL
jgi:hypothetical protein